MSLPWADDEIVELLGSLDSDGLAKVFANVVFARPQLVNRLPDLTKQLQGASDISDPTQQAKVLDWIEAVLPEECRGGSSATAGGETKPHFTELAQAGFTELAQVHADVDVDDGDFEDDGANGKSAAPTIISIDHPGSVDTPDETDCIVQFSTPVYYAKEGEDDFMIMDVTRLGPDTSEVSCCFHTVDGDGKAGQRYEATSGELVFKPGEIMKQVHVDIIEADSWSSSLEFKVVLSDAKGCMLGRYLYQCRVKVIDPDCFPSNKFEQEIRANNWSAIPMLTLLFDYFKFNYHSNPIVHRRSKYQLCTDQITNLYFILRLYIGKTVIDKILRVWSEDKPDAGCHPIHGFVFLGLFPPCPSNPSDKSAKYPLLMISAIIIVIPMFLIHTLEYKEVFFKIGGTSRKTIQGNLVRKFLNYDETARQQIGPSDLIMGITRDTKHLVHDGYMQLFPLAQNIGKLILMVILQVLMGADLAVIPVFVYPVVLCAFLKCRNKITIRMSVEQDKAQNQMVQYTTQLMTSFRLIGDYLRRPDAVEETEALIGAYNKKTIAADAVNLNNKYVCKWLALICVAGWNVLGGIMVLGGSSEVGTFVTNLQIFNDVGASWTTIFECMLKMQNALPYLEKIVRYMNLPIDLEKRMRLNRKRRSVGEEARKTARGELDRAKRQGRNVDGAFAADFVPISLVNVSFGYLQPEKVCGMMMDEAAKTKMKIRQSLAPDTSGSSVKSITSITLSFQQGVMVAVVGLPGNGKSTLMRVMGGQVIPDDGDLLIPPHLRCLHVSGHPIFLHDTLFNNLTYGVDKGNSEDGADERVRAVCKQLQVSDYLFKYLDRNAETDVGEKMFDVRTDWGEILSQTQCFLLNLARAFIANPEMLVIHKPTNFFDDKIAANTWDCLRDFVNNKGLCMDPNKIAFRRPRTCIMTTERLAGVGAADKIFKITPRGISEVRSSSISLDMLI